MPTPYYKKMLSKRAGTVGQLISAKVSQQIPYLGNVSVLPGFVAKAINKADSTEDYQDSQVAGYIPGVSSWRLQRRRNQIPKIIGAKKHNQTSHELLGGILSSLLSAGVGAATGAAIHHSLSGQVGPGAVIGGIVGGAAPNIVAAIAALISRKRTLAQQKQYEQQSGKWNFNYLPGGSAYNQWKNYGVLMGDEYQKARQDHYKKTKNKKSED